ncbi:MAG: two-component system sensor histidine kinase NtrB [Candidatus Nitrospinota bacterium M3_3B_026]
MDKHSSPDPFALSLRHLVAVLSVIFAGEAVIMSLIHQFLPEDYFTIPIAFLDALFLFLIAFPLIYFFYHRPLAAAYGELLRAEEKRQLLLDGSPMGIYEIGLDGRLVFANRTCVRLLGYRDRDELTGGNAHKLFHYKCADGTPYPVEECEVHKAHKEDAGTHVETDVLWRADGESFPVEYWSNPLVSDGRVTGSIVTFIDVTERRETEERLRKTSAQLIRSEKLASLGELSAGVAHELKNPLNIVSTSTQLLMMDEGVPAEVMDQYKIIMEQVGRSVKIIENLRDFGRERKPEVSQIDLHEFLNKTLALVEYEMKVENIDIVRSFAAAPLTVEGDPDQLAQVFLNIINNARESMNEKQKTGGPAALRLAGWKGLLEVGTRVEDGLARVSIKDTGTGVPAAMLEKVFDPFFTTKGEKGTGLGLSIAFGIVENHGGRIEVASEEGGGTEFRVFLPLAPRDGEMTAS